MSELTNTERYLKMRELHPEWNDTQIAKELCITKERARQIRRDLRLPPSKNYWRHDKSEKRLRVETYLLGGGYGSDSDTAKKLGLTTGSVRSIRVGLGLPVLIKRGLPKSEKRLQIEAYLKQENYLSDRHTAEKFNTIFSWVATIRHGLGLPPYRKQTRDV